MGIDAKVGGLARMPLGDWAFHSLQGLLADRCGARVHIGHDVAARRPCWAFPVLNSTNGASDVMWGRLTVSRVHVVVSSRTKRKAAPATPNHCLLALLLKTEDGERATPRGL